MRARFVALLLVSVLVCLTSQSQADSPSPGISAKEARGRSSPHKFVLSNGLEVLVVEDHRLPSVSIEVGYRVGRRDDPPRRRGLAELFKPLLEYPSTRHLPSYSRQDIFSALGKPAGIISTVEVHDDYTRQFVQVPSHFAELALFLEADSMGFLGDGITSATLEQTRHEVEESWAKPEHELLEHARISAVREILGPQHPYGHLGRDLPLTLEGLTVREVMERWRNAYGPGNATLVIAGDVDTAQVEEQVKRYFGPLLQTPRVDAPSPVTVALTGEKRLVMEANTPHAAAFFVWPTAAFYSDDDIALDVASRVLASHLHIDLVVKKKIAQKIGVSQVSRILGSTFVVFAEMAEGHDADEVRGLFDEKIRNLGTNGPGVLETTAESTRFLTRGGLAYASLAGQTERIVECFLLLGDPSFYDKYLAGYANAKPADVQRVVAKYLHPTKRVVVTIKPNKDAPANGRLVEEKKP